MTETQLQVVEERLRLAMLRSDVAELELLLAPTLMFTTHMGLVVDKKDDLAFHQAGVFKLDSLTPSEQRILLVDGLAIVSVLMHLCGSYAENPLDEHIRYTRVWAMKPALQVIAGHASALVKN